MAQMVVSGQPHTPAILPPVKESLLEFEPQVIQPIAQSNVLTALPQLYSRSNTKIAVENQSFTVVISSVYSPLRLLSSVM